MNSYKKLIQISTFCMIVLGFCVTAHADLGEIRDVTSSQAISRASEVVVLDVRTAQEFSAGHIANAINVDIGDSAFAQKVDGFDRSKTYLVHCGGNVSKGRASKAINILSEKGFSNVENLVGGYVGWISAGGKPVTLAKK